MDNPAEISKKHTLKNVEYPVQKVGPKCDQTITTTTQAY